MKEDKRTVTYVVQIKDHLMPKGALQRIKEMGETQVPYSLVAREKADNCATRLQKVVLAPKESEITRSPLKATLAILEYVLWENLPKSAVNAALDIVQKLGFTRNFLEVAQDEKKYADGVPYASPRVEELETAMESTVDDSPMDDPDYDPDVADAMLAGLSPEPVPDPPKPGDDDTVEQEENGSTRPGLQGL